MPDMEVNTRVLETSGDDPARLVLTVKAAYGDAEEVTLEIQATAVWPKESSDDVWPKESSDDVWPTKSSDDVWPTKSSDDGARQAAVAGAVFDAIEAMKILATPDEARQILEQAMAELNRHVAQTTEVYELAHPPGTPLGDMILDVAREVAAEERRAREESEGRADA